MKKKKLKPPARYNQASLIRELEKRGLGTKSTRANIISILYVP
jgi:DNA topoisomerase-1